jgi:poly(hydroxyalkanoate) depolymerase family esterase
VNYRLFIPEKRTARMPLLVALHGCRQAAEDFAHGTRFDALGERYGSIVLYPEQDERSNGHRCWNWFLDGNQRRDGGEPAKILDLVNRVVSENDVDRSRIFAAGLSSGAAMAAILAEQAPDVFAGVGAMAGVPLHAASDVNSAYATMRGEEPAIRSDGGAHEYDRAAYRRSRAVLWTGSNDRHVVPLCAWRLARQFAHLFGLRKEPDEDVTLGDGRRARWRDRTGAARIEVREIDGIGHAWSGGSLRGSYTAPNGPSFSDELLQFFFEEEREAGAMRQCG